jgi:hypothetical protein
VGSIQERREFTNPPNRNPVLMTLSVLYTLCADYSQAEITDVIVAKALPFHQFTSPKWERLTLSFLMAGPYSPGIQLIGWV